MREWISCEVEGDSKMLTHADEKLIDSLPKDMALKALSFAIRTELKRMDNGRLWIGEERAAYIGFWDECVTRYARGSTVSAALGVAANTKSRYLRFSDVYADFLHLVTFLHILEAEKMAYDAKRAI